jgi:hypothetical protein
VVYDKKSEIHCFLIESECDTSQGKKSVKGGNLSEIDILHFIIL